jgi:selenide,water dikinase
MTVNHSLKKAGSMIKLTQTVKKGGCAAKVPAEVLREILSSLKFPPNDENVLIDGRFFDDAGIYQLTPELCLVQTIDFFTPIVDTPKRYGEIATANALSDVYAMGGSPKTALGVLAFPLATMDKSVIQAVMQGACDKLAEAKVSFLGGHSIDDDTLKFGMQVTGIVHPDSIWSNQGCREGDVLILTKPIGTGTLTAGLKKGIYREEDIEECLASMSRLNNISDFLPKNILAQIHAATDVTGFALSGHAMQMALASEKTFEIDCASLPIFSQAEDSLLRENLTKAHATNRQYTEKKIRVENQSTFIGQIIHDPQTSGGLLLSVDANAAEEIVHQLKNFFPGVSIVGKVGAGKSGNENGSAHVIFC